VSGRVTERTYYPILIDLIKEFGGMAIQEVTYPSAPDIIFRFHNIDWFLDVKIGKDPRVMVTAFKEYLRHKEECKMNHGLILFLPENARVIEPDYNKLKEFILKEKVYFLLDTPFYRDESSIFTFQQYLSEIEINILPNIQSGETKSFSLNLAVKLLREQVLELMQVVNIEDEQISSIISNSTLFFDLGNLKNQNEKDKEYIERFLGAYIFLSQILFLRILSKARNDIGMENLQEVNSVNLKKVFKRILEINYRPIFSMDVLNTLSEDYIKDTYDIIWGLKIEEVQYELPGRIYNELMPPKIRKLLAAFFTKPIASELLSALVIDSSTAKVYDPACGSGTLLVSAYKRKKQLFKKEGRIGDYHRHFCEEDIFGTDIMPFSTHLTAANLASSEPKLVIHHTQISNMDSLTIDKKDSLKPGFGIIGFFKSDEEENITFKINEVDVILMNPPFTKKERGIKDYINLEKYNEICGNQVGLWGHFIPLAMHFLKNGGMLGAILPISILKGRESEKVRELLFKTLKPTCIVKPVINYGFSESAEYRDIMIIVQNRPQDYSSKIKFVLLRKDLTHIDSNDITKITKHIKDKENLTYKNELIELSSFDSKEVVEKIDNLMFFCGLSSFRHRDIMVNFIDRYTTKLTKFPPNYFREGYRPVPEGISKVLFLTRNIDKSRLKKAFLSFDGDDTQFINALTNLTTPYNINKKYVRPTLRTPTGIKTLSLDKSYDYIINKETEEIENIIRATNFKEPKLFLKEKYWEKLNSELDRVSTNLAVIRRINPFSPNCNIISFFSKQKFAPSNQLHPIMESNEIRGKSLCVLFNSIIFWVQFFVLKGESTGRRIDIRHSDLYLFLLYPSNKDSQNLAKIYDKYSNVEFSGFPSQLDIEFDVHYKKFKEIGLNTFERQFKTCIPDNKRLNFDKEILEVLGYSICDKDLIEIYSLIVKEMVIIKALNKYID
jgi:type I restriction-modification system DNA methylase subunit